MGVLIKVPIYLGFWLWDWEAIASSFLWIRNKINIFYRKAETFCALSDVVVTLKVRQRSLPQNGRIMQRIKWNCNVIAFILLHQGDPRKSESENFRVLLNKIKIFSMILGKH